MKIAVFGNIYQQAKIQKACRLLSIFKQKGLDIAIDEQYYSFLKKHCADTPLGCEHITDESFTADVALSMGGDGTFLQTATRVAHKGIPILGINMGRLGFLADVSSDELEEITQELTENSFRIEERTMIELHTPGRESLIALNTAINDIAILKQDTSSMITIDVEINGQFLNTYQADGLIVATPSGSTAYSLSVGGPIIAPQSHVLVLTPIAPHSLNVRPLVITENNEISLNVKSRSAHFLVAVDGRSTVIEAGTSITIKKSAYPVKVIKRKHHTFYETLREKLMWGVDKRKHKSS